MSRKEWLVFIFAGLLLFAAEAVTAQDGATLLDRVAHQDLAGVKAQIEAGVDVNYQDDQYGNSALGMACTYNFAEITRYLIENGADVNIQNKRGETPLMGAAYCSEELAALLVSSGADIDMCMPDSTTAFTFSIVGVLSEQITTATAKLLLEKGADVDECACMGGTAGYTCLMMVARNNNLDLAKFLVANKADVNATAGDGATPLSMAKKNEDEAMIKFLKESGAEE